MSDKYFVDTNILVYAQDLASGDKCSRAQVLMSKLWEDRKGVISTQVLQELYDALRRKLKSPISALEAAAVLRDYSEWEVVVNNRESIFRAIDMESRYKISFWDALVLQAAERAGAQTVYSEDLSHGGKYAGMQVVNPFIP
ncbi:MAG TPA: PIN domain-containing protein [Terriglobales bacterium]|jgi:predicted nucleic acid-binding protein|nr:PIN domain-containing protein [Terriglobales bacterium]